MFERIETLFEATYTRRVYRAQCTKLSEGHFNEGHFNDDTSTTNINSSEIAAFVRIDKTEL